MIKKNNIFSAVTTFDVKKHFFSKDMVNSFIANWPENVNLLIFMENSHLINIENFSKKVQILDYHKYIPEYEIFCKKFHHKKQFTDDFRYNVFRFAYKVYAIKKSFSYIKANNLIWLDADIKTHKKIPNTFLEKLISDEHYLSYLGRSHIKTVHLNYSECGFLIFNTKHPLHSLFWKEMMLMYDNGGLFELSEWHDSYIFDHVRKKLEKKYLLKNINITDFGIVDIESEIDDHIFVLSILGEFMDHKKGERKSIKWSPELLKRIKKDRKI